MLVQEMNLGETKVQIYDDKCVPTEEVTGILDEVARIVQTNLAAQEMKKRESEKTA